MDGVRTLTIVKTDLEGFTRRVENMTSAQLDDFLRQHRLLVGKVLGARGGRVFKEMGDAVLACFDSSTQALLACVELQREVTASSLGGKPTVGAAGAMRIMVAAGDVLVQDGDVFGPAVNAVDRLEAFTPAGDIYLTQGVYQNCNRQEVACQEVRTVQLDGFDEPVRVYRTTFRHQTREMNQAAVLFTDIAGFTRFVLTAALRDVEDLLEAWGAAQRECAATYGGVVRDNAGDAYLLTFDEPAAGVRAWIAIARRARALLGPIDGDGMQFGAGLSVGMVRVFKSAVFGPAAIDASLYQSLSRQAGRRRLVAPAAALDGLSREDLDSVDVAPLPAEFHPGVSTAGYVFPPLVVLALR
jgi:class 3 adenylate cyclase